MPPGDLSSAERSRETALAWPPGRLCPPASALRARAREVLASLGAFEWLTFGYFSALNLLIVLFRENLDGAWFYVARHHAIAAGVVLLCWAERRWSNASLRFTRHWYPHVMFLFCFEELHYLVRIIFPNWFDVWLIRFDYALAGTHPTVWLEQFSTPALNDIMQAAYMTYFFYLVVLGGALYARREMEAYWAIVTSTAAAYYAGYLTGVLFPIESPYHSLAAFQTVELAGGPVTALINWIESWGRVHGAAFPSAHVSGSFVALLGAWRYRRWLFWIFLPLFLAMLVSTVYGRYHYIADVLGGLLYGWLGFWLGHRLVRTRRNSGSPAPAEPASATS